MSYTYSIQSGSLPIGTSLDTITGEISGTVTTIGTGSFVVRVTDSDGRTSDTTSVNWVVAAGVNAAGTIANTGAFGQNWTITSTGSTGSLNNLTWILTFTDPGFPNNGRIITIVATSIGQAATAFTVTDTGGTPLARLDATQLSGTAASWSFTAGASNDIALTGAGSVAATITVTDTGSNTDGPENLT